MCQGQGSHCDPHGPLSPLTRLNLGHAVTLSVHICRYQNTKNIGTESHRISSLSLFSLPAGKFSRLGLAWPISGVSWQLGPRTDLPACLPIAQSAPCQPSHRDDWAVCLAGCPGSSKRASLKLRGSSGPLAMASHMAETRGMEGQTPPVDGKQGHVARSCSQGLEGFERNQSLNLTRSVYIYNTFVYYIINII